MNTGVKVLIKILLIIACIGMILWCATPSYVVGWRSVGVAFPIAILALLIILIIFWGPLSRIDGKVFRFIFGAVKTLLVVFAVSFAGISIWMASSASGEPAKNATVIVLGCKINGRSPSLMLSNRLTAAYEYLEKNPESKCIVSGGQGDDEQYTEAEVMKEQLVMKGIAADRIIMEPKAVNTQENIANSRAIIEENNLSKTVVIATDEFHQCRAQIHARREGLDPSPASSSTPWWLVTNYWVRDYFGVILTALGFSS